MPRPLKGPRPVSAVLQFGACYVMLVRHLEAVSSYGCMVHNHLQVYVNGLLMVISISIDSL